MTTTSQHDYDENTPLASATKDSSPREPRAPWRSTCHTCDYVQDKLLDQKYAIEDAEHHLATEHGGGQVVVPDDRRVFEPYGTVLDGHTDKYAGDHRAGTGVATFDLGGGE